MSTELENKMEVLERIKQDLLSALITLDENSLSDKDKIKECDKIILEALKFIDPMLSLEEKRQSFIEIAYSILKKRNPNIGIILEEYRDGDVYFEFYISEHDYTAGRDSEVIKREEIEKEIIIKSKKV